MSDLLRTREESLFSDSLVAANHSSYLYFSPVLFAVCRGLARLTPSRKCPMPYDKGYRREAQLRTIPRSAAPRYSGSPSGQPLGYRSLRDLMGLSGLTWRCRTRSHGSQTKVTELRSPRIHLLAVLSRGPLPTRSTVMPPAPRPTTVSTHRGAGRLEARMGDLVVKRFCQPSPNQELILASFQERNWLHHLDDPLPRNGSMTTARSNGSIIPSRI